jgi:hypothetical protein
MIIGIAFAFAIAETALRIMGIGYGYAPLESDPVLHHVHPADYYYIAYTPTGEFGGFEIYYDRTRLVADPAAKDNRNEAGAHECTVALMGDSFTEAGQVPYRKSFAGLLAGAGRCTVKNFGTSSYSPMLYLLQWRQWIRRLHPSLVVVQLYSNDIEDDINYRKLALLDRSGEVTAVPGPGGGWFTRQLRRSYLLRFFRQVQMKIRWAMAHRGEKHQVVSGMVEENPAISRLSSGLMRKLAGEVRKSGADFAVFVIPSKFRLLHPGSVQGRFQFSDRWKIWAKKYSVRFIDMVKLFEQQNEKGVQMFFKQDIHFTENGHRAVAMAIADAFPDFFVKARIKP